MLRLDNCHELIEKLKSYSHNDLTLDKTYSRWGTMYCHKCSEDCLMDVEVLHFKNTIGSALVRATHTATQYDSYEPSLFEYACVNCSSIFYALLYSTDKEPILAILPNKAGGMSTPKTPPHVKYYIDQAYTTQLVGAYSAAMSMYRSAWEQLLEQQKISGVPDLLHRKKNKQAPQWINRLKPKAFEIIKTIANSHTHANKLDRLKALSPEFMDQVQSTFRYLLHIVYEEEPHMKAIKTRLKTALRKAK
jgi:Fe-S oxidoreductase